MGKRYARDNRPEVKPVTKVELSKKNMLLRGILVGLLIVFALACFGYAVNQLFSANQGWQEIKASSGKNGTCGGDFIFQYELGKNGTDATVEKKRLSALYSELCENAYDIFQNDIEIKNVKNLYYINRHPNEQIQIDQALYRAFEKIEQYDNRMIYLAPIYKTYDDIFYCQNDQELSYYDATQNELVAQLNQELLSFAGNEDEVCVKLLGNNTIELYVSSEYLAFAKEEEITDFIDFIWMKNAFIIDYIGEALIEKGYDNGILSSYDGFTKSLSNKGAYSFNLYAKQGAQIYQAGVFEYSEKMNLVNLRSYPMNSKDVYRFYQKENGQIITPYLSMENALQKMSISELTGYSENKGCCDILLSLIPVYINENFDKEELRRVKDEGIYSIYMNDFTIYHNDEDIVITDLYENEGICYQVVWAE